MLDRLRQRIGMNSTSRAGGRPSLLRLVLYAVILWLVLGAVVSLLVGTIEAVSGVLAFGMLIGLGLVAFYVGYQACGWVVSVTLGSGQYDFSLRRR